MVRTALVVALARLAALAALVAGVSVAPVITRAAEPRVVVLDPGHGGKKTGAKNLSGVTEANIVLAIARHTRGALEKAGVRVVMTRDDDRHLELDERVALANGTSKVAAFVSIHANWAPAPERHGTETYILHPNASDDGAAAVVDAENDGHDDAPSKVEPAKSEAPAPAGDLDFILQDLQRMTAHQDSALLARHVDDVLGKVPGIAPSRGLKQAPFRVLRGAKMPAALVEVGYLSNPSQGALLATAEGQRLAGEAIARGIVRFLEATGERL